MSATKLIAIDFGSTHISAMAGEVLEDGSVRVISVESKAADDVKWGIVEKPSGASFKVSELLKLLRNSARMPDISMVSVPVGAKSMKLTPVSISRFVGETRMITEGLLEDMMKECRRRMMQPEGIVFEVIPAAYILDGIRVDDAVGSTADQITAEYHVVTGSKLIRSELERCFDRTGIMLECSPLAIEAVALAVMEEHEQRVGCALINMGATTTTLAVYHDDILQHLMIIPLGAKNITIDIQELGVSFAHAERLKCLKGCAMESKVDSPVYIQMPAADVNAEPVKISTRFLANIIEARLEEMLSPVFEVLDGLPFQLEAGIILSGGGAQLANVVDFIAEKTGLFTRIGDHAAWLDKDSVAQFSDPSYSQLIGTLLLNNEYRKEHPIEVTVKEPEKKPKLPGKKMGSRITEGFFKFFNDDNKME